jgi:hypothetical protein
VRLGSHCGVDLMHLYFCSIWNDLNDNSYAFTFLYIQLQFVIIERTAQIEDFIVGAVN